MTLDEKYECISGEYYPLFEFGDGTGGYDQPVFIKCGDLNMDYEIDLTDLTTLSVFLMNDSELSAPQLRGADIDGNHKIDIADLATLKQIISNDPQAEILGKDIGIF